MLVRSLHDRHRQKGTMLHGVKSNLRRRHDGVATCSEALEGHEAAVSTSLAASRPQEIDDLGRRLEVNCKDPLLWETVAALERRDVSREQSRRQSSLELRI